jgi:hypothetical protein
MLKTAGRQLTRPQGTARLLSNIPHRARTNWNLATVPSRSWSGAADLASPSIAIIAAAICASYVLSSAVSNEANQANPTSSNEIYDKDGPLTTLVWGSNKFVLIFLHKQRGNDLIPLNYRNDVLNPESRDIDVYRTPAPTAWSQNVALRDLVLHEKHAACVDVRGDVYQWGEGFYSSNNGTPNSENVLTATLRGKDIIRLQLTESRVFALSASGRIYVLATKASDQNTALGKSIPSSASWWSTGWLFGKEQLVDFTEVKPKETLHWGERWNYLLLLGF